MKRDKAVSFLWSCLLSFLMGLSAAMWLVTAFDLGVDTALLAAFCAIASVICSLCYSMSLGAVPIGLGALALGYLWRSGALELSVEAILNRLSRQYNKAYNWGIIRWGMRTADEMEPTIVTVLCILAALVVLTTAWAVCRRKSAVLPVLSTVFVVVCFVVNDTPPDSLWIYLLFAAVLVLVMTGTVRRQDARQGNRLCLLLTPAVVLGLLVLFAVNPRSTYDRQTAAQELLERVLGSDTVQYLMSGADNGTTGVYADVVDLTVVGYRTSPEGKVMEVTAPFTGTVYLRSKAMDTYDGVSWSYSGEDLPWPEVGLEDAGEVVISTRFAHQMLYVPYYSRFSGLSQVGPGVTNDKNLKEYSFYCWRLPNGVTAGRLAELSAQQYTVTLDDYLHLTPEVKVWAEALALKITDGAGSFYEKAERIASYVRNCASYNLETPRMPAKSKDFARWFLESSDTGYCVHFATATAVLLQSIGIPARYVTGYAVGVEKGVTVEVKSKQSHAWVEYWLPGFGWTVLEATPAAALPEVPQTTETQSVSDGQTQPTTPPEASTAPLVTGPAATTETAAPDTQLMPGQSKEAVLTVLLWTTVAAAALAAVLLQRSLRLRHRRKQLAEAEPNARALLCWQESVTLARLSGLTVPKTLLTVAELAKFSHHTVSSEQLQQFADFREEAVAQLKKRNLFLQIYYRLILVKY